MPRFRATVDGAVIPEGIYEPVPPGKDGNRQVPKGRCLTVTTDGAALLRQHPDQWEDADAKAKEVLAASAPRGFAPERNTMIAGPAVVKAGGEVRIQDATGAEDEPEEGGA